MMSPMLAAERLDLVEVVGDQGRRHQLGELGDEQLLGRVADMVRVVDHQRLRVDAVEQVRGRDVGEVEGRVLAHQDHVHGREVDDLGRPEADMVAALAADLERAGGGDDAALAVAQLARQIVVEPVAAALRLQRQGEAAVAVDVDGLERVHLDRDGERHACPRVAGRRPPRAGRRP